MSTCSKIILLGEHSVVYGEKALAIPVKNIRLKVKLVDYYVFESEHVKYIKSLIEKNFNVPKKYIKIWSKIPSSSGMGSSAALAIEIARKYGVDERFVVNLAEEEKHGRASGIDANVIINERALVFQKNKDNEYIDELGAYLVISNTNQKGRTKEAIKIVKDLNRLDLIEELGKITSTGIDAYKKKNVELLGKCFISSQKVLRKLNISTKRIEYIIDKSKGYSLGSKLSGGGLGGVVISLCKDLKSSLKLKKRLQRNKIKNVFIVKI